LTGEQTVSLPISTERLILRRFSHKDVQDVIEFVSHPSVARITREIKPSKSEVKRYIDLQNSYEPFEANKCFDLGIELTEEHKIIGLLTLICRAHQQGQIGWSLNIAYRGRGYVTEGARALIKYGFENLGLHRIWADTSNVNIPSWKVMERLGMRREGCYREAEFRDNQWIDTLVYAILAEEWQD
jgi:ribosomal-protein-alanine N-acetyltransferase